MDEYPCQYCFLPYESCTCCKYCSCPKGTCECHLEKDPCTMLHPSDVYKVFPKNRTIYYDLMGIKTLEDVDDFVMKTYSKEVWPERLKNVR